MTLLNVKKTSLKKSEINKITYIERHIYWKFSADGGYT